MTRRQLVWFLVLIFILAISLHVGLIIRGFYGISADESGRTLDAVKWISSGTPLSDVWLPFHRIVVGYGIFFFKDLFVTPRVISFIFSLLALIAVVWFSHELFHDRHVTILAALLATLFPPLVVLSVVPLSEIEFIACIIASLASYIRWLHLRTSLSILATGFFIGLSTSIRYEGWIFAALFIAELVVVRENRHKILQRPIVGVITIILCSFFCAYWMYVTYMETKTVFSFFPTTASNYIRGADTSFVKLIWRNPATQFIYQNGTTLNLVGVISFLGLSKSQKPIRLLMVIVFLALIILAISGIVGKALPTHNPWRIPVVLSCLLIPFTAYWIGQQMAKFASFPWLRYGFPAIILVAFIIQIGVITHKPFFSRSEFEIGRFLKKKIEVNNLILPKVLIETSDWSYVNIIIASNQPDLFIYNTGFWPRNPTIPIIDTQRPLNILDLDKDQIRFLVFKSKLSDVFWLKEHIQEIKNEGDWTVYEIRK